MTGTELREELLQIGQELQSRYKSGLQQRGKIATGKLFNSIDYEVRKEEGGMKLFLNGEEYMHNVEEGRRPGTQPPLDAIYKWMIGRGVEGGRNRAWLIVKNIKKEGIKPTFILKEIKESLNNLYKDRLEEAIKRDIRNTMKENLKNRKQ